MRWFLGLLVIVSTFYSDIAVVASDGKDLTSDVSSKASRCDYYIFIDKSGDVLEVIQNTHKDVSGGASNKLVAMLNEKRVSHIIAASFGDKLIGALQSNDISHTVHIGSVESASATEQTIDVVKGTSKRSAVFKTATCALQLTAIAFYRDDFRGD